MGKLLVRLLINAVALWAAAQLVAGIRIGSAGDTALSTLLLVALLFGLVNALIKPVIAFVTCPFYLLTLGLFTFIVNALMLLLTEAIAGALALPFAVDGFGAALWGSIVISIVSFLLSLFLGGEKKERE